MEIRPLLPDLFFRQLGEKDLDGISRSIENAVRQGEGTKHLLLAMQRFAGQQELDASRLHSTIVVDALADLVSTFGVDSPSEILLAGARYLIDQPVSDPQVGLFDPAPGEAPPEVIPISSLEDALGAGTVEGTCRTLGRLLRVIQTKEYLLEVLLEAVASEATPDGHLLIHASAATKALHQIEWDHGKAIAYRLVERLSQQPIEAGPAIAAKPPAVPCRGAFLASIEHPYPERFWLYLSHAFQVERYAQMRTKGVRWGLRAWIAARLFDGDEAAMDCAEENAGPRPEKRIGQKLPAPTEGAGLRILEAVSSGRSDENAEAMRWAQTLPDVDPLYRWIAGGAARALAQGDPRPLLATNAARWGCHLLGPLGAGILTERLMDRLPKLMGGRD